MDNNLQKPEGGDKKPFHKHNHHRRKPSPRPLVDEHDSSPNGQVIVRGGRYDLPPSASGEAHEPSTAKAEPPHDSTSENRRKPDLSENKRRRSRGGRRRGRRPSDEAPIETVETDSELELDESDEMSEIEAPAEPLEPEVSEVTLTANADPAAPSESEIIEELNSAATPEEAPGEPLPLELELVPEPEPLPADIEIVGVKFKATGKIYYFDPAGLRLKRGDSLIVDTARGLEFGTVELGNRMVTEREVVLPLRQVVRKATEDDIARAEANAARAAEAFTICGEKIVEHRLAMKLVDVEYTFDNSKLLFYFTADGRVDFRELVKDLASVFRTRIELRQIGIRDETKLLGGIGICGRPFCCKTFLSDFVQVSIKMAKEQSLSLNSAKISGACGRLMCCLRYEYDVYTEEIRKTPKLDQIVSTPDGDALVVEVQPLAGLVKVRFVDRTDIPPKVFHRDDVTVIGGKGFKKA